jgi:hypothetical protein
MNENDKGVYYLYHFFGFTSKREKMTRLVFRFARDPSILSIHYSIVVDEPFRLRDG